MKWTLLPVFFLFCLGASAEGLGSSCSPSPIAITQTKPISLLPSLPKRGIYSNRWGYKVEVSEAQMLEVLSLRKAKLSRSGSNVSHFEGVRKALESRNLRNSGNIEKIAPSSSGQTGQEALSRFLVSYELNNVITHSMVKGLAKVSRHESDAPLNSVLAHWYSAEDETLKTYGVLFATEEGEKVWDSCYSVPRNT